MLRSIDYRVQLSSYNKKEIHQYGVCFLHVRSKNHVKLCKFSVVDSRFNPILGVNSACHLSLLKFTEPVFENWTDITPIKSSKLNIDAVWETSKDFSPDKRLSHLFQGIGHFKCNPISIEMQEGSTPVRKPTRKVPLVLCKKFKQEIDLMVKAGILTEVSP